MFDNNITNTQYPQPKCFNKELWLEADTIGWNSLKKIYFNKIYCSLNALIKFIEREGDIYFCFSLQNHP